MTDSPEVAALRELVACMENDPIRDRCHEWPGFRWYEAWIAARAALAAVDARGEGQPDPTRKPNDDEVICPGCTCQFRAVPVNVQAELRWLRENPASPHPAADAVDARRYRWAEMILDGTDTDESNRRTLLIGAGLMLNLSLGQIIDHAMSRDTASGSGE